MAHTDYCGNEAIVAELQERLRSLDFEGKLTEMICAGLPFAAQGSPKDRHPMQTEVLQMAAQVLARAKSSWMEKEATSKQQLEAARSELDARKAAQAAANDALAAAQAAVIAKKDTLGDCRETIYKEEQVHKKAEAADKAGKKIMAGLVKSRDKVVPLLASIDDKKRASDIVDYLCEAEADPVLAASAPAVLGKEPADRVGFDLMVAEAVKEFLSAKVAAYEAEIQAEAERQADAHAEAVGAFAVLDIAKDRARDVAAELEEAKAHVQACRAQVTEANTAAETEEHVVYQRFADVTTAEEKARLCRETIEIFSRLEKEQEARVAAADVEMSAAVTA